jgi:putative PIN family toxin of toxin-antitoxin system
MMRVVLDSNVYLSAVLFGGNPRFIIEAAQAGLFEIASSSAVCAEVERVLREKFGWPQGRIDEAGSVLWRRATQVSPAVRIDDCSDPDDNRVLECAVASEADAIVTGDHHLLALHPYGGIAIVNPRRFLERRLWAPP